MVAREVLRYKGGRDGTRWHFPGLSYGEGAAVVNEEDFLKADEEFERQTHRSSLNSAAIKGLGQFERFRAANAFRQLIEH